MALTETFEAWLSEVQDALRSINMDLDDWQSIRPFDFKAEHKLGSKATDAAMKANRFWWREQNKSLGQACRQTADCWLPRGHQGPCQPA